MNFDQLLERSLETVDSWYRQGMVSQDDWEKYCYFWRNGGFQWSSEMASYKDNNFDCSKYLTREELLAALETAYEAWKLNNIWLAISESLDDTFDLYENFNDFCISYGCRMIQCCNGVGLYHSGSNHFYIVYKNRVVRAYGYHGENVYKQLSTNPDAFIASYENLLSALQRLKDIQ